MRNSLRQMAVVLAVGLAVPVAALGASRDTKGSGTRTEGTGAAESGSTKAPSKKLTEGLEKLHAGNQAEIQGGKLAQQAAMSSDVKSFGQKMVDDHGQADQKLTSLAQTMNVNLEGKEFTKEQKDAQKRMSKVEKKTGADFDKAYMSAMVKDHEKDTKDVKKLADEARKDGQTEVATLLDQTEQVMQGHLTQAKQIEDTVKKEKSTASSKKSAASSGYGSSMGPPPPAKE